MRLRNIGHTIRVGEEGQPPKRIRFKLNISRLVYLIILLLILGICVYFGFEKVTYIQGVGLITFNPVLIRAEEDLKLKALFIKEGDFVKKNDKLSVAQILQKETFRAEWTDDTAYRRKLLEVENEIRLKQVNIGYLRAKLGQCKNELIRMESLVALEAVIRNEIMNLKKQMSEIRIKISQENAEIRVLETYKTALGKQMEAVRMWRASETAPVSKEIFAPIDGQVVKIYIKEDEIGIKGEPILQVASLDDMIIKGYFDQKFLTYLTEGKLVRIEFPDGNVSKGRIGRFYYSTLPLPEEFQKKYEPVRRELIVDILPIPGEERKWSQYHKLSVTLKILRYEYVF